MIFVAAAPLAPAASAAPSSINDCEKIQAADAYNQCLAIFGPVAHLHGAGAAAKDFGGDGDGADVVETANPEASVPQTERHSSHSRHSSRHSTRRYHYHSHSHSSGHSSVQRTHGASKKLAFSVISGRTKTR
jgi:hypothetical protein